MMEPAETSACVINKVSEEVQNSALTGTPKPETSTSTTTCSKRRQSSFDFEDDSEDVDSPKQLVPLSKLRKISSETRLLTYSKLTSRVRDWDETLVFCKKDTSDRHGRVKNHHDQETENAEQENLALSERALESETVTQHESCIDSIDTKCTTTTSSTSHNLRQVIVEEVDSEKADKGNQEENKDEEHHTHSEGLDGNKEDANCVDNKTNTGNSSEGEESENNKENVSRNRPNIFDNSFDRNSSSQRFRDDHSVVYVHSPELMRSCSRLPRIPGRVYMSLCDSCL